MKILVTGGAGFIGSHLCERLLSRGHEVWAFDNLDPFYDPELKRQNLREIAAGFERFRFVAGDITTEEPLASLCQDIRFDQIIHLAARAGVRPSLEQPALYQRVNVEGTVQVLEAARRSGVRKLVLASSSSVYGCNAKIPFSESDPLTSPISPYAASKIACEALGHVYHRVYGLDVVMLRFFTVYGPRQRPDLAIHKFARLIQAGQPVPVYGDGRTARDYTYISDILDGIEACLDQEFGYEIFNLGDARPVQLEVLINLLEAALKRPVRRQYLSAQPGDVPITCADIHKAADRLGYQPRVPLEEGIQRFVTWFLNQGR
ncbi:MAG: GDP-mannose 4,6-dehydratase [Verrucomicrobiota bacterium]|nr:GDP-mannose 4,6-dehydratase [Limisphaera sp.]MDW8380836.1 GDP-mannose 4,6-dehydratase [Verrucomicrobiota bacterium]